MNDPEAESIPVERPGSGRGVRIDWSRTVLDATPCCPDRGFLTRVYGAEGAVTRLAVLEAETQQLKPAALGTSVLMRSSRIVRDRLGASGPRLAGDRRVLVGFNA